MKCPFCSADETRVVDSRLADDGDSVRRRRECEVCNARFTTFERAELRLPQVIKSDSRRESFNEDKLRAGLSRALEKRPVTAEAVEAMVARLRHRMITSGEREVASRTIGEWVMEELRDIDPVAYVRFASVYRSFEDLEAFRDEVQRLQDGPSPEARRRQLSLIPENGMTPAGSGGAGTTNRAAKAVRKPGAVTKKS